MTELTEILMDFKVNLASFYNIQGDIEISLNKNDYDKLVYRMEQYRFYTISTPLDQGERDLDL